MRLGRGLLLELMVLAVVPAVAGAQDPVPLYPRNYRVLVENDRVRVLDFRLRKGDTEETHSHPAHVLYVLESFRIRFQLPGDRTVVREAKAGDVLRRNIPHRERTVNRDEDQHQARASTGSLRFSINRIDSITICLSTAFTMS